MKSNRLGQITAYLQEHPYCRMTELAAHFKVSSATIHRDIDVLSGLGQVRKVHGGVVSAFAENAVEPRPAGGHFLQRMELQREAKARIAESAEREIENGDIVFLDSSTTSLFLARRLQESRLAELSIVTNSVLIAQEFHRFPPQFVLLCVGGNFNVQLNAFLGRLALETMKQVRISKAFLSCAGYTGERVTTYLEEHAVFLQGVLEAARRSYLLVDHSKEGRVGLYTICETSRFTKIICE